MAQFLANAGRTSSWSTATPTAVRRALSLRSGDVTDDETLLRAGIERAATLVAALDTDADNLYVTVAGQVDATRPPDHRPGPQRVLRAEAGAGRRRPGGEPPAAGGDRMASFVTQPHVVDFVDVVMHDGSLEFRLEELVVPDALAAGGQHAALGPVCATAPGPWCWPSAARRRFLTNPSPEDVLRRATS